MVSVFSTSFFEEETKYIENACNVREVSEDMNRDERIFMRYCAMQLRFANKYGHNWAAKRIRTACIQRQKQKVGE